MKFCFVPCRDLSPSPALMLLLSRSRQSKSINKSLARVESRLCVCLPSRSRSLPLPLDTAYAASRPRSHCCVRSLALACSTSLSHSVALAGSLGKCLNAEMFVQVSRQRRSSTNRAIKFNFCRFSSGSKNAAEVTRISMWPPCKVGVARGHIQCLHTQGHVQMNVRVLTESFELFETFVGLSSL